MKMKLLLKLCIYPTLEPRGVFIATREEGAREQTLAQNATAAATIKWPRAVLSVPCQLLCPVSGLQPLVLTESAS